MEELRRNQKAMKVEINQLKTQMGLIMEIQQSMMRKEGNSMPTIVPDMVAPVNRHDPTPPQEQSRGFHPQPVPPRALYQQPIYAIPMGPPPMQYRQSYTPQRQNHYKLKLKKPERSFDVLPMSYNQLLARLLQDSLLQYRELGPPPTPLPSGYDTDARCEFHSGMPGHTVEICKALKHKVQDLIDSKVIVVTPQGLKIVHIPMPPQEGTSATS